MKLGLIGNPLGHSWSPEIHKYLIGIGDYGLWQLEEDELDGFFAAGEFDGINVTIPYKQTVIRYLDEIDGPADRAQAVNCIINRDGKLKGYNTDILGLKRLMSSNHVNEENGNVAILGTGGASRAAGEACRLSGWKYYYVSRSKKEGCISYDELYEMQKEISVIINATPVGMYPNMDRMPVDLDRFTSLKYLVDIVANPLRTTLMYEAQLRGIKAYGGLGMLVGQALEADEIFLDREMDDHLIEECVSYLRRDRQNILLIGMPSSGKTTIGRMLADKLGRPFLDLDEVIVSRIGMPIADFFALKGEDAFRDIESEICGSVKQMSGMVISSGGGVIKRRGNMVTLSHNCDIFWIDRDPELLIPTDSRPLSSRKSDIARLYNERKDLYELYSDVRIPNDGSAEEAVEKILKCF